jgi:hypothetical protein
MTRTAYGKHFQRVSMDYNYYLANRRYELKADPKYYTRSDKGCKHWYVYGPWGQLSAQPAASLTDAMSKILEYLARLHRDPLLNRP